MDVDKKQVELARKQVVMANERTYKFMDTLRTHRSCRRHIHCTIFR